MNNHPDTDRTSPSRGAQAERWARQYLEQRGLRTLTRNYRTPKGEIDLIMMHGDTLVFVEVRLRQHSGFASAAQSIDSAKQRRIIAAARHYLQATQLWEKVPCRFDAMCLGKEHGNGQAYRVEWLQNAFSLP